MGLVARPEGLLTDGKDSHAKIRQAVGGVAGVKRGQVVILLRVQGEMKPRSLYAAWASARYRNLPLRTSQTTGMRR